MVKFIKLVERKQLSFNFVVLKQNRQNKRIKYVDAIVVSVCLENHNFGNTNQMNRHDQYLYLSVSVELWHLRAYNA